MRWLIVSGIGHRRGRTAALAGAIAVAAASFALLLGASSSARLHVVGTVAKQGKTPYDILVRPRGAATPLEVSEDVVQRNFLSKQLGGITRRQLRAIDGVPGVAVAAPIALVGYVLPQLDVPVRLHHVLGSGTRQLFRVRTTWTADGGLTRLRDADSYVYVTRREMIPRIGYEATRNTPLTFEVLPSGRNAPICRLDVIGRNDEPDPFSDKTRRRLLCWSRQTGLLGRGDVRPEPPNRVAQLGAAIPWPLPFLVAAVDPEAEARLSGLDRTVVRGRYLRASDGARRLRGRIAAPVLLPSRPYIEQAAEVRVERIPSPDAILRADSPRGQWRFLDAAPDGPTVLRTTITADAAQRTLLARGTSLDLQAYWTAGPVRYAQRGSREVAPLPVTNSPKIWRFPNSDNGFVNVPLPAQATHFRRLTQHRAHVDVGLPEPALSAVGTFDPGRLPGFADPRIQPLGLFNQPAAQPRRPDALAGRSLRPSANFAGYLTPPPLALTTFAGLRVFFDRFEGTAAARQAPISAVRVRVAGASGLDALSRERIRSVADLIARRTGLRVDITSGSSPTAMTVDLPPLSAGAPPLTVTEDWVKKGVAVTILTSLDRKSLVLFLLILVVCALSVANATAASLRSRRTELGVLAATGWPGSALFRLILGETALVGAAAGALGAAVAVPASLLLDLPLDVFRLALCVPVAALLAMLAGLWPAFRAARLPPAYAIKPAVSDVRRARPSRSVGALALVNLLRVPGRTLLCVAALALAVAALTILLAVLVTFHGALVGSLLGDAVAVQVRGVDTIAVTIMVLLGGFAVADVLYLNVRERAPELAALSASGWRGFDLARLVAVEGVVLGGIGSIAGAGLGVAGATAFAGGAPAAILMSAGLAAIAGVAVATAASVGPALVVGRLPTTTLLAEE